MLSSKAQKKLIDTGVVDLNSLEATDVVFVGCGGIHVKPESVVNLKMSVYGCEILAPTVVVQDQQDDLIIGSNVIRHLLRQFKKDPSYWEAVSTMDLSCSSVYSLAWTVGLMTMSQTKWARSGATELLRCKLAVNILYGGKFLRVREYCQAALL